MAYQSWSVILTLILTIYVALDGFDLGIGILSLLERDKSRQVIMMESLSASGMPMKPGWY